MVVGDYILGYTLGVILALFLVWGMFIVIIIIKNKVSDLFN